MLGNLARATYVGSSEYMWPYSYNKCDLDKRMSQEINACDKVNHYGLAPERGRGAPEIDILEAMQGIDEKLPSTTIRRPYQSASLQVSTFHILEKLSRTRSSAHTFLYFDYQVAPGVESDRPVLGLPPRKVCRCVVDGVVLTDSLFVTYMLRL
jgi:hypothetical protein